MAYRVVVHLGAQNMWGVLVSVSFSCWVGMQNMPLPYRACQ